MTAATGSVAEGQKFFRIGAKLQDRFQVLEAALLMTNDGWKADRPLLGRQAALADIPDPAAISRNPDC